MTSLRRTILSSLFGLTAIATTSQLASAMPITASSAFTISWSLPYNTTTTAAAAATFSGFDFSVADQVKFTMDVTNTSTGTSANDVRFTSFGWDTNPATSAVTDTTSVYSSVASTKLGSDTVSVCFYSGSNCDGGSSGGLEDANHTGVHNDPTTTGNFTVTLNFGKTSVPPLNMSNFDGKFQGGDTLGSIEGFGTCTAGCTTTAVPEPVSLALFSIGMIGTGIFARRRSSKMNGTAASLGA